MASKKRISPVTGKPVRAYKKRAAQSAKGGAKKEVQAVRGGSRSGAGRKSSEVHFAQLNAKVDTLAGLFALLAEKLGVDPKALAAFLVATEKAAKQEIPASADHGQAHAQAVAHDAAVMEKAAEPAPTAPVVERRKPGRPRKIVTAPPAPPAPVAEQSVVPVAPVAPVAVPAPVAAPAQVAVTQPVVSPPAPIFAPQVPGIPAPQSVSVAQQTWPQQPQQPVAPVTFSPPPPPPPVAPQFAVGVAPLNVQPVAPVQPAPQAPHGVDFEAQFQSMQNGTANQPK